MTVDHWPPFNIRITTPRLELRLVRDDEIADLVEEARSISRAPGVFAGAWAALPEPEFSRGIAQFQWRCRAEWTPESWQFGLGVFVDNQIVGVQDMGAKDFANLREVLTGSWLGSAYEGKGDRYRDEGCGSTFRIRGTRVGDSSQHRPRLKRGFATGEREAWLPHKRFNTSSVWRRTGRHRSLA